MAWALIIQMQILQNHNSLKTRVLRKNAGVVIAACPYHILHNAAGKAFEAFATVSKFDLENHCVDVFHWFEMSTKTQFYFERILQLL